MIVKEDKNFISMFNPENGFYIRTGVIEHNKDTGIDPFMASYPELIDVGVMGHCLHGKLGMCKKAGIECYQSGLLKQGENMTVEDFESILKQSEGRTFQIALGGRGDPDMHENFEELLKLCKQYNVVPNFTTSGIGMTMNKALLCKEYCGAVAVSWYRNICTYGAIRMLLRAGVRTNIHYVVNNNTIDEAINRLQFNDFPGGINAVIFLLHKPVGLGSKNNVLKLDDERVKKFYDSAVKLEHPFKVGFDSCSVPYLLNYGDYMMMESLDTCEGARWSCYISSDMKMMPCSFDQKEHWAESLRDKTIEEVWNGDKFEQFRSCFEHACPECDKWASCMGGCPICSEIVLCKDKL